MCGTGIMVDWAFPGQNKNSKILFGSIWYLAESQMHISYRLQRLDHLLSELVASWHGILILVSDVNIDMIKQQTSDVKRYTEMPSNHWTWSKSSPKQQELRSPVKRLLITLLTIFLNALHILMFSHVHSLAITTRHMFLFCFFFLINIYPGASNLAELVRWSPDTKQKQRH